MPIIDVQVHAYERNHPARPWAGKLHGPQSANGEEMVAAMDAVGVDAAIIVSTFNRDRYDPSYALRAPAEAQHAGADPVLRGASGSGEDFTGQVDAMGNQSLLPAALAAWAPDLIFDLRTLRDASSEPCRTRDSETLPSGATGSTWRTT